MKKRPAVFLDRDGVLTKEEGYVLRVQDMHIFSYSKACVTRLHAAGYYVFVVSNQSAIARGLISLSELSNMNNRLIVETGVDNVYFCPHYPDKSINGGVSEYLIDCECRKPKIGMIRRACEDFDIDMSRSWMIGDRWSDIEMGVTAGVRNILVRSMLTGERAIQPEMFVIEVCRLDEAVDFILNILNNKVDVDDRK